MAAFYQTGVEQHQYSSPFAVPNHNSPLPVGHGLGGGYHPSPVMAGASSPSQMETSSYLPAYLLGGPSSPSPSRSPQRHNPYHRSPQKVHLPSSPMPFPSTTASTRVNKYTSERKHDLKPGGPPVHSLHEHTKSPVRQQVTVTASPERRQLTFSGTKSLSRFNNTSGAALSPSFIQSPATSLSVKHSVDSGVLYPSPPSPSQMDPFYTQGEDLTSDVIYDEYWITIFGFPPASTSYIMEQFSQYGTILSHKMSSEGNWMHLQYQTKLQAKKALSKNGRIYGDGIMVGVQPCIDKSVIKMASQSIPGTSTPIPAHGHSLPLSVLTKKPTTMRPLTAAYQASSSTHEVAPNNPNTPQKSTGFISRTLEYVFGW